jgi:hypothetical protein
LDSRDSRNVWRYGLWCTQQEAIRKVKSLGLRVIAEQLDEGEEKIDVTDLSFVLA